MNAGTLAAVMKQVQAAAFPLSFASLVQHFLAWDLSSSAPQWLGCRLCWAMSLLSDIYSIR